MDLPVPQGSNASQSHVVGDTAWQHLGTRRAWVVDLAVRLLGVPLGVVVGGVGVAVLPGPGWVSAILIVLFFIAGVYGVCRQVYGVRRALRVRRVLRTYSWQVYEWGLPHSFGRRNSGLGGRPWFKLPDPENPGSSVPVYLDVNRRNRWWLERMAPQAGREAKADIQRLWFAGDPRFRGVLAVPGGRGPRRMLEVPAGAGSRSRVAPPGNASPEALTRALEAGVRLPELAIPAVEAGRAPVVPVAAPPAGPALAFPATRRSMRLRLFRGAVLLVAAPMPFLWLFSLGPWHASSAKGLGLVLVATVIPAFKRLRSSFILRRTLRSRGTPWRTLDVEVRHRGRALVLVTGNEALRTQLALRRLPAGRAQVWFVGDIYGRGVVSLRGDGVVMPVRCTEHGRPVTKPEAAVSGERPRTRRWGPVG